MLTAQLSDDALTPGDVVMTWTGPQLVVPQEPEGLPPRCASIPAWVLILHSLSRQSLMPLLQLWRLTPDNNEDDVLVFSLVIQHHAPSSAT
jgi:hypothetical protein